MTKLFLGVDNSDISEYYEELKKSRYILTSFFYVKDGRYDYQKLFNEVILDSGAFSFMSTNRNITKEEMNQYCDRYIEYINKFDIKKYVELDVDSIFGYEYVLHLRKRLENGTGKKCIPIWHLSRGEEDFIRMCKEYNYAGVGGIASGEKLSKMRHLYKDLNLMAKKYGCKLHSMGFTPAKNLNQYGFYSTDSTSWKSGRRFGVLFRSKRNEICQIKTPKGMRIKDYKVADIINICEWIKYQKNLDRNV